MYFVLYLPPTTLLRDSFRVDYNNNLFGGVSEGVKLFYCSHRPNRQSGRVEGAYVDTTRPRSTINKQLT